MKPPESFVPLTTLPAADEYRELHVTVIPQTLPTQPLAAPAAPGAAPGRRGPGAEKQCEPSVSLQCDGDRITHIRVQCACGQVMELACVYDPAGRPT